MIKPILDQDFKPAIIELRKFNEDVAKSENKQHLIIAVERNNGYVYRKELDVFADGIDDERNVFIVERLIKSILWVVGGYKIYISGSKHIAEQISSFYKDGGYRDFDYHFMWDHFLDPGYYEMARILFRDMQGLHKVGLNGMMSCQTQRSFLPTGFGMAAMAAALWDENFCQETFSRT